MDISGKVAIVTSANPRDHCLPAHDRDRPREAFGGRFAASGRPAGARLLERPDCGQPRVFGRKNSGGGAGRTGGEIHGRLSTQGFRGKYSEFQPVWDPKGRSKGISTLRVRKGVFTLRVRKRVATLRVPPPLGYEKGICTLRVPQDRSILFSLSGPM